MNAIVRLEDPANEDDYLLNWRTVVKAQAARIRIGDGAYELLPRGAWRSRRETKDETLIGFPCGDVDLIVTFRRGEDDVVFGVIDECRRLQQGHWDKQAADFNSLSMDDRKRILDDHWAAKAELASLYASLRKEFAGVALSEELRRIQPELSRRQARLLPFSLITKRGEYRVWPRKSIGR